MLKKIASFLDDALIMVGTMIGLYVFFTGLVGLLFNVLDYSFDEIGINVAYAIFGLVVILVVNATLRKAFVDKVKEFFKKSDKAN